MIFQHCVVNFVTILLQAGIRVVTVILITVEPHNKSDVPCQACYKLSTSVVVNKETVFSEVDKHFGTALVYLKIVNRGD